MSAPTDEPAEQVFDARVIESFGRHVIVEGPAGARLPARLFGRRLEVVCGDRVRVRIEPQSRDALVIEVRHRQTLFARTDTRGRFEPLAANLSLLGAMVSPEPPADPFVVDRYLAGGGLAGIDSIVIASKADLASARSSPHVALLGEYRQAGYEVHVVSVSSGAGLDQLRRRFAGEITLLAGQSGVGKSTLTNELVPGLERSTRELSTASGEGRHTTVSSALLELPDGGQLIDSPGVRDYAPPPVADIAVQRGYREILARARECRFNDCLHLREPGCRILRAIELGEISPRRYESYRRLLNLMRSLAPSHERPG